MHSINSMIDRRVRERGSSRNLRLSPAYLAVASVIILLAVISMVLYFPKTDTDLVAVSEQPKTETPEAKESKMALDTLNHTTPNHKADNHKTIQALQPSEEVSDQSLQPTNEIPPAPATEKPEEPVQLITLDEEIEIPVEEDTKKLKEVVEVDAFAMTETEEESLDDENVIMLRGVASGSDKKSFRKAKAQETEVFTVVEQMPEFPGGEEALQKYLSDSLQYPESALRDGLEGRHRQTARLQG